MPTTLTSTGAVSDDSPTNWSPSQTPAAGDDLIVGAATLTFNRNWSGSGNRLGSITFNHASSRFAFTGSNRTVEVTNGITISGGVAATLCSTPLGSGVTLTVRGRIAVTGPTSTAFSFCDPAGGTFNLQAIDQSESSEIIYCSSGRTPRLIGSLSSGNVNTTGLINQELCGQPAYTVVGTGGTWTHRSSGVNKFGSVIGGVGSIGGAMKIDWTGSLLTQGNGSAGNPSGFAFNSSNADSRIGQSGDTFVGVGATTSASYTALVQTAVGGGTLELGGTWTTRNRCLTLAQAVGTIRYRNQPISIPHTDEFVVYKTGGTLDLSGLVVSNSGKFVVIEASGGLVATDAVITNQSADAQAASNASALIGRIITLESDPPTLPAAEDVAAGSGVYGYTENPITPTGLVIDPAILAAAVQDGVGLAAANLDDQLDAILTAVGTRLADADYVPPEDAEAVATQVVSDMLEATVETGLTYKQSLQALFAVLAGKVSGAVSGQSGNVTFKGKNDTTRLVATVDENGNRTAMSFTFEE